MRRAVLVLLFALIAAVGAIVWWFKLEPGGPVLSVTGGGAVVGRQAAWDVTATTTGHPGLRWIEVRLSAGGQSYPLFKEEFPPDGPRVGERSIHVDADLAGAGVPQGPAQLEVSADTYAWHLFGGSRGAVTQKELTVDTVPPRVDLLTTQHNMRLGGMDVAVFRLGADTVDAAVVVDKYSFPVVRGYFADPAIALALFAVPQDLTAAARPLVRAVDGAGNTTEIPLPVSIKDRHFPERKLDIDDAFLQRKVPEILSAVHKPVPADLKEGYLIVNRDVRRESEEKLHALTAKSVDQPLWSGTFHRQTNAAPMSAFADRRSYVYNGETIDRQTHLGYDLASLKRAPVEAAQDGVVVFADYLGIYGNTVVIDHGLGMFSLYGHLSGFAVQPGQQVKAGDTVGQTGETGLAGGDHLHFSVMLHGTHVDPVEWWDPHWIKDHVTAKLTSFPAAKGAAAVGTEAAPAAEATPHGEG